MAEVYEHKSKVLAVRQLLEQRAQHLDAQEEEAREEEEAEERQLCDDEQAANESDEEEAAAKRRRRRAWLEQVPTQGPSDGRGVEDMARDHVRSSTFSQQPYKLSPPLPTIGRGMSVANEEASRKRRELVYPYPGGIYGHICTIPAVGGSDGFQQRTGFSREELDAFYAAQGGDRGLFQQARNRLGEFTEEENKERRLIRGLLSDRDRVFSWMEMLRKDLPFGDQEANYGPSKGTFSNDFFWLTIAAAGMEFLHEEIKTLERATHGALLQEWGHPDMVKVVYIADGTKILMRNPSKVGRGLPEPHDEVHSMHYSRNKGLGWSHIV
ncbi:unnamed protein product, partial [Laminaria digitata]